MNPSELVVSLDLAKRLKAAGFPLEKCYLSYNHLGELERTFKSDVCHWDPAPTNDELLAELPWVVGDCYALGVHKDPKEYHCGFEHYTKRKLWHAEHSDRLPDALARLWLWWAEQKEAPA